MLYGTWNIVKPPTRNAHVGMEGSDSAMGMEDVRWSPGLPPGVAAERFRVQG